MAKKFAGGFYKTKMWSRIAKDNKSVGLIFGCSATSIGRFRKLEIAPREILDKFGEPYSEKDKIKEFIKDYKKDKEVVVKPQTTIFLAYIEEKNMEAFKAFSEALNINIVKVI